MDDINKKLYLIKEKIIKEEPYNIKDYCYIMLERVSRTFSFTINVLEKKIREPVMLGYLFCRIADTFEDTDKADPSTRKILLLDYYKLFEKDGYDKSILEKIKGNIPFFDPDIDEEFLASYPEIPLKAYQKLPKDIREIIKDTVLEMIYGMVETIDKSEEVKRIGTETISDLNMYCYYVAGTVGRMLTRIFEKYSPWINNNKFQKLTIDMEAFGKGLQLTNIIKDSIIDIKRNVSFIPRDLAYKHGVPIECFYEKQYREQANEVMNKLIIKAIENLNCALRYTISIPKAEPRIRLFCLWPIFLAMKTFKKAIDTSDLFNPDNPVKISRQEVKQILKRTTAVCLWDYLIVREFKKFLHFIEEKIGVKTSFPLKDLKYLPITISEWKI